MAQPILCGIVQPANEASQFGENGLTRCPIGKRLQRHVTGDEPEHLTALVVVAERLRHKLDALRPQVPQESLDGPRERPNRPSHGVANPDDARDPTLGEYLLVWLSHV